MLDDTSVLQADAAIIAGVLILLTIVYTLLPRPRAAEETIDEKTRTDILANAKNISRVMTIVVAIFSGSAIFVATGDIFFSSYGTTSGPYFWLANVGKIAMIIGFGFLAFGIWRLAIRVVKQLDFVMFRGGGR